MPRAATPTDLDPAEAVEELLRRAGALEHGATRVGLTEEAVRLADLSQNEPLQFRARMELTEAASVAGRSDLLLVAYAWCLALADKDPGEYLTHSLMWNYKWVVNDAASFASIPRAQLEELLDDMERRHRAYGSTLHAVRQARWALARWLGDPDEPVRKAYRAFKKAKRDSLSNCAACVLDATVRHELRLGRLKSAMKAAAPIVEGALSCRSTPHSTYCILLVPLLRLGEPERAAQYHRAGYRLVRDRAGYSEEQGNHMAYLALTGRRSEAVKLIHRHLPAAAAAPADDCRCHFATDLKLTLELVGEAGWRGKPVPAPPGEEPSDSPRESIARLYAWADAESAKLVAAFDARNGNDGYARWHAETMGYRRYALTAQ